MEPNAPPLAAFLSSHFTTACPALTWQILEDNGRQRFYFVLRGTGEPCLQVSP